MDREEWKRSSGALRELLNKLPDTHPREGGRIRHCRYKFGALYNRRYRFWHIYNSESKNVVATVRFRRNRILVRYRPNSIYRYILQSPTFKNHQDSRVIIYPSTKLFRHKEWIMVNIHDQVVANRQKEEAARERDFLESQRQNLRPTSSSPQGLSGMRRVWEQEYALSSLTSSSSSMPTELQQVQQRVLNNQHRQRMQELSGQLQVRPVEVSAMSGSGLSESDIERAIYRLRSQRPDIERVEVRRAVDSMSVEIRAYDREGGYMTIPMISELAAREIPSPVNPYATSVLEAVDERFAQPTLRPREEDV